MLSWRSRLLFGCSLNFQWFIANSLLIPSLNLLLSYLLLVFNWLLNIQNSHIDIIGKIVINSWSSGLLSHRFHHVFLGTLEAICVVRHIKTIIEVMQMVIICECILAVTYYINWWKSLILVVFHEQPICICSILWCVWHAGLELKIIFKRIVYTDSEVLIFS